MIKEFNIMKCTDCYEENPDTRTRCGRCGRQLERPVGLGAGGVKQSEKFEVQHADAPNVMRTDRSVYRND
jgi:ribosomal protein S27E